MTGIHTAVFGPASLHKEAIFRLKNPGQKCVRGVLDTPFQELCAHVAGGFWSFTADRGPRCGQPIVPLQGHGRALGAFPARVTSGFCSRSVAVTSLAASKTAFRCPRGGLAQGTALLQWAVLRSGRSLELAFEGTPPTHHMGWRVDFFIDTLQRSSWSAP